MDGEDTTNFWNVRCGTLQYYRIYCLGLDSFSHIRHHLSEEVFLLRRDLRPLGTVSNRPTISAWVHPGSAVLSDLAFSCQSCFLKDSKEVAESQCDLLQF